MGVVALPGDQRLVGGINVITVHEIKARAILNAVPQRMRPQLAHTVPSHMRNLKARTSSVDHGSRGKPPHATMEQAQSRDVALFTALEEHLQTNTDAKKRLVGSGRHHRGTQATGIELAHAIRHRALPRKNHPAGTLDLQWVIGHTNGAPRRNVLDRLGDRTQIAHPIIDDGDISHDFA